MFAIIFSLFSSVRQGFRSRAALHAEILALRHQLLVLQRANRERKLRLGVADRLLWAWLSQALEWLAICPCDRQTRNSHCLASPRLPALLELEEPPSAGPASDLARSHRSDSQDEPGQSALGRA